MAGQFRMSFVSDVRDFLSGSRDVEDALDDVAGELDDVAREAQDASRKVGDAFQDAGRGVSDSMDEAVRDADSSLDRLTGNFRELVSRAQDAGRDAGRGIGDNVRRGARDAADAVDDFKDESSSSMREAAASFDGSAESIQDVFQEISANALAGFGPAGALAGLATAVGAGVLFNYLNAQAENTKQRLEEAFQDMVDNASGAFSEGFIEGQLSQIFSGADEAVVSLEKLQRTSEESGVAVALLARAYAGDMDAMEQATEELQRKIADDSAILGYEAAMSTATGHTLRDLEKQRDDWDSTTSRVEGYKDAVEGVPGDVTTDIRTTGKDRSIRDIRDVLGAGRPIPLPVYVPQQSINDVYNTVAGIRLPALTVQVRYGQAAV